MILSKSSFSQLTIDETATSPQLVNNIVQPGYTSNMKLNCPTGASATFTGTSDIGFEKGIILSTGKASSAKGPNDATNTSFSFGAAGDLQLDSVNGTQTFDACTLEFDLIPTSDTLRIRYVFGSEEYPEFINQPFRDALGFFVSGPGITGNKNIAIDALSSSQNFVDNTNGTSIQYDGFTKPLTALQALTPNAAYHLKIVIADVADALYDSGVFIEAGSITTGIKTDQLDALVQVYPNPADEVIYIQAPLYRNNNLTATIYSVLGKLIYTETYANNVQAHQINTAAIETNGIYFIKLQAGNETITRKIIINH
jgi:hypothetical protein